MLVFVAHRVGHSMERGELQVLCTLDLARQKTGSPPLTGGYVSAILTDVGSYHTQRIDRGQDQNCWVFDSHTQVDHTHLNG